MESVVKHMIAKAESSIDSFIQLFNTSTTINDMLSVTFKDRLNSLKSANIKKQINLIDSVHYLYAYL